MQTVCAHCYARLPHRRQRTACILCTRCEQNWLQGKAPVRSGRLPGRAGSLDAAFGRSAVIGRSQ